MGVTETTEPNIAFFATPLKDTEPERTRVKQIVRARRSECSQDGDRYQQQRERSR